MRWIAVRRRLDGAIRIHITAPEQSEFMEWKTELKVGGVAIDRDIGFSAKFRFGLDQGVDFVRAQLNPIGGVRSHRALEILPFCAGGCSVCVGRRGNRQLRLRGGKIGGPQEANRQKSSTNESRSQQN